MTAWRSCTLGDVLTLQRGFDLPSQARQAGAVPIISSSGLTGTHSEARVKAPGVVIGRYGTLGQVHFVGVEFWPLNTTLYVKDFKGNSPKFCAYLLETIGEISNSGAAAVPGVNRNVLHLLPVKCPPIGEQRRIASILGAYDDLIDVNRRRIALLEDMARGLFEEWFVRFRFPGHENQEIIDTPDGPLPDGWQFLPLDSLCSRITDGSHHSPPTAVDGQLMASVRDMRDWGFDYSDCRRIYRDDYENLVKADCKPLMGDILIAKDGANLNKHTFCVWREEPSVILSSIAIVRPLIGIGREYLVAYLKSDAVSASIKNMKSGAAIPRIILRDFKRLQVMFPAPPTLTHFERIASSFHSQCRTLTDSIDCLKSTRELFLPRLISGELSVAAAERDLEAAA